MNDKKSGRQARSFEELDSVRYVFGVLAGSAFMAFGLQVALGFLGRIHWALGALLSIAVLVGAILLLQQLKTADEVSVTRGACAAMLASGLFAGIVVFAWVSLTLHETGVATYSVDGDASIEEFTRLYYFTTADLVPALDLPATLHLRSPVQSTDWWAGWPILLYRIFVLWLVVGTFSLWRKNRIDHGKARAGDLALFMVLFLFLVLFLTSGLR